MDSRPSFSCVAGYIDRPEIILRSLKLKNNFDNDNDLDENKKIENNNENDNVIDFNIDDNNDIKIGTINNTNKLDNPNNANDNNVSSKYEIVTYKCTGKKDFFNLNDPFASCVLL